MFNRMTIRIKLLLGFLSVAIIAGIIGVTGMTEVKTLQKADTRMYEMVVVSLEQCNQMTSSILGMRIQARDAILAKIRMKVS